ncbi:MAG: ATP-dependent protease [Novosphingobium sp. 28-62-57]|uniref:LON peptidase substrate-binding domain-containing protein n=1 Tax=unclassified Novosphingobium TaxID=2644732 RepID=UPI000BC73CB8|nr:MULTISPECIES: LON peptidase substrate-binding domain-containing protein [unclassified Novosphingobium]OYZ11489.1 MAG: ATP-dependent protease [Novosphingobium sp. 28-62-57]OZA36227.1 MAG: ATP-dependent protease [Novosphingobium sp. 17-62-9]HQS68594.1 LON peptidase substrate-binding domain-containing protein [Novosphingobium sp.]
MGTATKSTRLSVFPLSGAVLYPGLQLPLHIFEPRYRAMVSDSLARDRRIAMIQPQSGEPGAPLFNIGCVGKIVDVEAMEDGRYNLLLEGKSRFRVIRELEVTTPFRQVEAELLEDDMTEVLSAVERASFERESRKFADAQGYSVDWDSVGRLDDMSLINGVSQIAPFDAAAKQALLEANSLGARCELLVQLMQFFGKRDSDDGGRVTLQ